MKHILLILFFVTASAYASFARGSKSKADPVAEAEYDMTFELSADNVFADSRATASLILVSPYEITDIRATGEPDAKNLDITMTSGPHFLGRKILDGKIVYVYCVGRYSVRPLKKGRHKIKSPEYDAVAITYSSVSDGFFAYRRPIEHQIHLAGAFTYLTVLPGNDPSIDTRRYPTAVAQLQ